MMLSAQMVRLRASGSPLKHCFVCEWQWESHKFNFCSETGFHSLSILPPALTLILIPADL
jgi:hypothetical protein